jgi:hypothetical protein
MWLAPKPSTLFCMNILQEHSRTVRTTTIGLVAPGPVAPQEILRPLTSGLVRKPPTPAWRASFPYQIAAHLPALGETAEAPEPHEPEPSDAPADAATRGTVVHTGRATPDRVESLHATEFTQCGTGESR